MTLLLRDNFVASYIGHLDNIGSLSHTGFSNLTYSITQYIKKHCTHSWEQIEAKLQFAFETLNFIFGNKYCQSLSWKRQAHLAHFWENVCQIPKPEEPSFAWQLFIQVNMVFHGIKAARSVTKSVAHVALLETNSVLQLAAKVLYVDFPVRNLQDLLEFSNNTAFFTASSRTFKSETRIFFHCERLVVMNMLTIRTVWCHCLCSSPGSSGVCYSPVFLCHQQMSAQRKRQIASYYH